MNAWLDSCSSSISHDEALPTQDAFTDVKFIRDDLHQLQAVTAYCVPCGGELTPVIAHMAWGVMLLRCPLCHATSMLAVSEHDNSRAA